MGNVDYCFLKKSLVDLPDACGDTGLVIESDNHLFWALIDVLGHGQSAHEVAVMAEAYLVQNYRAKLEMVMRGLHEHLLGTRGAVGAMGRLRIQDGKMTYTGMGNINTKLYGDAPYHLVPRDGIIGYTISSPVTHEIQMNPGDILVATSDGIREHFIMEDYPGLLEGSADRIAANFMGQLSKGGDDASCIVLRYGI